MASVCFDDNGDPLDDCSCFMACCCCEGDPCYFCEGACDTCWEGMKAAPSRCWEGMATAQSCVVQGFSFLHRILGKSLICGCLGGDLQSPSTSTFLIASEDNSSHEVNMAHSGSNTYIDTDNRTRMPGGHVSPSTERAMVNFAGTQPTELSLSEATRMRHESRERHSLGNILPYRRETFAEFEERVFGRPTEQQRMRRRSEPFVGYPIYEN
eukprot:m.17528 g.17528  ORF g.17528 m.17528 type:complete len:211 (+) comp6046_c0_seq1:315-947(+)